MTTAPYTRAEEPWDDVPTPEYAQRITFEGCEGVVMAPEDYERLYLYARTLERELAAAPPATPDSEAVELLREVEPDLDTLICCAGTPYAYKPDATVKRIRAYLEKHK